MTAVGHALHDEMWLDAAQPGGTDSARFVARRVLLILARYIRLPWFCHAEHDLHRVTYTV